MGVKQQTILLVLVGAMFLYVSAMAFQAGKVLIGSLNLIACVGFLVRAGLTWRGTSRQ